MGGTAVSSAGVRESFLESVLEAFARAEQASGTEERWARVGGHSVRQRFAGGQLVQPLHDAFAVRERPGGPLGLDVCLWDSASTGIAPPPLPFRSSTPERFGQERIRIVRHPTERTLFLWDAASNRAVYWVDAMDAIPEWERAAPMRLLLHWWTLGRPYQLVHSSAVGTPEGGVLLAGRGGSGKSTTALACVAAGLAYAGDDFVLAEIDAEPRVHALYGTGKLAADSLAQLSALEAAAGNRQRAPGEKAILYLDRLAGVQVIESFPLRTILLPRVTRSRKSSLTPASPAEALAALAPSTLFQLWGGREESFHKMAELVRMVPAFRLDLGSDLAAVPDAVREAIARADCR